MKTKTPPTVPVRRFEMGASGLYFVEFLESCGYSIALDGGGYSSYRLRQGNAKRYSRITRKSLMALVDDLRIERGLEPFRK